MYRKEWPLLVICPAFLRLNWRDELRKWLGNDIPADSIAVVDSKAAITALKDLPEARRKIVIISYDLATALEEDFLRKTLNISCVLVDEAHYLKNSGSKRSKAIIPFVKQCRRVILITGTPMISKPRELFPLLSAIRPDVFTTFKAFGDRFCDPSWNTWRKALEYEGARNVPELTYLLKRFLMIRRLKSEVLSQLPDKVRQILHVQLDTKDPVAKEIATIMADMRSKVKEIEDILLKIENPAALMARKGDVLADISKCYHLTGRAKIPYVKQYIQDLFEQNIKIILFAVHLEVLDAVEQEAIKQGVGYMRIDGSTAEEKRHENVQKFQNDENTRLAILSLGSSGLGLTLTASSTVVFAEMFWNPSMMLQAEDRAHRISQKSSVNCIYMTSTNTLDDKIIKVLHKKHAIVSKIIDNKDNSQFFTDLAP